MSNNLNLKGSANGLTAKQRRAVLLLASGVTAAEVAQTLGVSTGTVYNWKSQSDEFRRELDSAQRQLFEGGIRELKSLVAGATTYLRSVLLDPTAADRDKISAAKTVLQYSNLTAPVDTQFAYEPGGPDEFLKRMGLK